MSNFNYAETKPWVANAHTRIWDATEFGTQVDPKPATVRCWFVHAPWMHPLWAWHYAAIIHLRDIEGVPPAVKHFPKASHEFIVYALNPEYPPSFPLRMLTPASIVQQFTAPNDSQALSKIEHMLQHAAMGQVSLDSDFRTIWRRLLCPE